MRAFSRGEPFLDVLAEGAKHPVFSEAFLYSRIGKEDARFVLAIADEYNRLIRALGVVEVRRLLSSQERI